jgi:RNA polymerase sigma-70 factor (ECF subfamily)
VRREEADDDLIRLAAAGDRGAFDEVVRRHAPAVHRLARAMVQGEAAADDVTQEAFLAAFRAAATYRPDVAPLRTWLFAIARNAARRARRQGREVPSEDVELMALGVDAGWGAAAALDEAERSETLARALAALAPEDREILVLRDVEGMAGEATAAVLGVGLAAMKSRLHRARLRLLAALRAGEGGIALNQRDVGGLSCSAVLARLGDYVDGDLAPAETRRVDAHLRGCGVCERFGGRYARTVRAVRAGLGAPPVVDEAQLERIRALLARG